MTRLYEERYKPLIWVFFQNCIKCYGLARLISYIEYISSKIKTITKLKCQNNKKNDSKKKCFFLV